MKTDFFGNGTYWYMVPTRCQFAETFSVKEHENAREMALEFVDAYAKLDKDEQQKCDDELYYHDMVRSKYPNYNVFSGCYVNPIVFFVKNGHLVVSTDVSEEYDADEMPYVGVCDFMFDTVIPVDSIKSEITKKIGVRPKMLYYLGEIDLGRDQSAEVEGVFERDFHDDEEDKEYYGDDLLCVSHIDALICTDWEEDFKLEDGCHPAIVGLHELDKYKLNFLLEIFGSPMNYDVWARLLYHARVLNESEE